MASSTTLAVAFLVLVVAANVASATITCTTVVSKLTPCYRYVRGEEATVNPACCGGIKSLKSAARTTVDRQAACRCLKQLSKEVGTGRSAGLPGKCGVSIPYPISNSVDCDKVS